METEGLVWNGEYQQAILILRQIEAMNQKDLTQNWGSKIMMGGDYHYRPLSNWDAHPTSSNYTP